MSEQAQGGGLPPCHGRLSQTSLCCARLVDFSTEESREKRQEGDSFFRGQC